jgi:beta-alanine--pyruvate transaminase
MSDAAIANEPNLEHLWMPFTANRQFKAAPRLLTDAAGMYYGSADGRRILDGTAGLWCVNAGHARPEIAEAARRQLMTMDYAPPFQMGHPVAFAFAEQLAEHPRADPTAALTGSSSPGRDRRRWTRR